MTENTCSNELKNITDNLCNKLKKYDLIISDVDDVPLTPIQYLCSTTWYTNHYMQNKDLVPISLMQDDVLECFNATEYKVVYQPLNNCLSRKDNVFGLTSRPFSFSNETNRHLESVGMHFSNLIDGKHLENVNNGVIYAGFNPETGRPNNKGKILYDLLNKGIFNKVSPDPVSSILFIDDSEQNIKDVKKELGDNFDLETLYFTYVKTNLLEKYTTEQLIDLGNYQFNYFKTNASIPSDEEACTLKGICPKIVDLDEGEYFLW